MGISKTSYNITIVTPKVRDSNDMCYQTGRFRKNIRAGKDVIFLCLDSRAYVFFFLSSGHPK